MPDAQRGQLEHSLLDLLRQHRFYDFQNLIADVRALEANNLELERIIARVLSTYTQEGAHAYSVAEAMKRDIGVDK